MTALTLAQAHEWVEKVLSHCGAHPGMAAATARSARKIGAKSPSAPRSCSAQPELLIKGLCHAGIMAHHDECGLLCMGEPQKKPKKNLAILIIQCRGGLIGNHQAWCANKGPRHGHTLLLTHRELMGRVPPEGCRNIELAQKCFGLRRQTSSLYGRLLGTRRMIATAEAAGVRCVIGHGFGLGINTMAEIIVASTSLNVIEGVECVGPLKTRDDIVVDKLDLSRGVLPVSDAPGLGVDIDPAKLELYRLDSASIG
jgi:hypothetical protein